MELRKGGYFFLRHRRRGKWTCLLGCKLLRPVSSGSSQCGRLFHPMILCLASLFWFVLPVTSDYSDTFTYTYETKVPLDPIFLETDNNITVREGGSAELPCSIQHLGTKKVAWRRVDGDQFLSIGKMSLAEDIELRVKHLHHTEELDDWNLVLPKVRKEDAGLYECQLTSIGGYHTHVRLNVVGPPITDPGVTLSGTQFVERGGQIKLQCNATGGKQIADQIDWFKDGNIISSPDYHDYVIYTYRWHEQGALVSTLQVDRATSQHAGTYVCRSSYDKLQDIQVQVLVADSVNVKRGTISSNNSSTGDVLRRSSFCVLFCLIITQWTTHVQQFQL